MAFLNTPTLDSVLQSDIGALTTASDSCYLLIPGLKYCTNVQNSVVDLAKLPNICTQGIPNGQLVFAKANGITAPVVASNCEWIGLDGKVFRSDKPKYVLWTWGCNSQGQLGNNTTVSKSSPVSVVGGFTDWCQVSAGANIGAAVKKDGTLWTWGNNGFGQLGHNTSSTCSRSSPVSVVGGFTDWCQVSAGSSRHSAALRTNGTLWTWGTNNHGQLGNGTVDIFSKNSPVSVVGGFTDWCQVSAGNNFTAAVRTNGTLWTWGSNSSGALGDNTTVAKSSPVSVAGGFTDWCQVSTNNSTVAAVRTNGTLWTWGRNTYGQLGNNTTVSKSSPVSVVGGFTDWCRVSAGTFHIAAIRTNGTLWTWGYNGRGQLGDNTLISKSSPVSVVGGFTDWCQVSAFASVTSGLKTDGTAWSWGGAFNGVLGDNTTVNKSSPVSVVGGFTTWCQISVGQYFTAAILVK